MLSKSTSCWLSLLVYTYLAVLLRYYFTAGKCFELVGISIYLLHPAAILYEVKLIVEEYIIQISLRLVLPFVLWVLFLRSFRSLLVSPPCGVASLACGFAAWVDAAACVGKLKACISDTAMSSAGTPALFWLVAC